MKRIGLAILDVFLSILITLSTAQAGENGRSHFHAPNTSAEKTLSHILDLSDHDDNLFEFILARPWYDGVKDKGYSTLFTRAFLDKWAGIERTLVLESCNGIYKEGEACGLDYAPITCGQDVLERPLFFKTMENDGKTAKIQIAPAIDSTDGALYILQHENQGWVLDVSPCPVPKVVQ